MKLTNRLNLPAALVRAIENDPYDKGDSDYSTTGLLRPPRIAQLARELPGDGEPGALLEDVADKIWALFGQITHSIIERAATTEIVEHRLFMDIEGKKISGQVDLLTDSILWDFKTTSVYSGKDGAKDEWIQQGNINRLLCERNGINVAKIQYVALYRDWSVMKQHRTKDDYPESQVGVFNIPMWTIDQAEAFIRERIRLHEAAKVELPLCTEEERWAKPEKWAHMKRGAKRAVKLYDSEIQAVAAVANAGPGNSVEYRPGENTRCLYFCPVAQVCRQFREMMQDQ